MSGIRLERFEEFQNRSANNLMLTGFGVQDCFRRG